MDASDIRAALRKQDEMGADPDLVEIMGEAIADASGRDDCPSPMPLAYWEAMCALQALRDAGYEVRPLAGEDN